MSGTEKSRPGAKSASATTTIWLPLSAEARQMLGACRREAQRREPGVSQPDTDAEYGAVLLEATIRAAHAAFFPKLIVDPGAAPVRLPPPPAQRPSLAIRNPGYGRSQPARRW